MLYKKFTLAVLTALLFTGCASTGTISQTRGTTTAQLTQAQLEQYQRQRTNETLEAENQAKKASGYAETIRQGSSAVNSAVGAIHSIKSLF